MNFSFLNELEELFFAIEFKKIPFYTYKRLLRNVESIVGNEILYLPDKRTALIKISCFYFKHLKHIDLHLSHIFIRELGNELIIDLFTNFIYEINDISLETLTRILLFLKRLTCNKQCNIKITDVFFENLFSKVIESFESINILKILKVFSNTDKNFIHKCIQKLLYFLQKDVYDLKQIQVFLLLCKSYKKYFYFFMRILRVQKILLNDLCIREILMFIIKEPVLLEITHNHLLFQEVFVFAFETNVNICIIELKIISSNILLQLLEQNPINFKTSLENFNYCKNGKNQS